MEGLVYTNLCIVVRFKCLFATPEVLTFFFFFATSKEQSSELFEKLVTLLHLVSLTSGEQAPGPGGLVFPNENTTRDSIRLARLKKCSFQHVGICVVLTVCALLRLTWTLC